MATLDSTQNLPQYRLTLKYHSSRPPSTQLAKRIGEFLELARHISLLAYSRLTDALNQGRDAQGTSAAAKHHFCVDNNSPQGQRDAVITVMRQTEAGLNGQVTLADVLSRDTWDEYKFYRDKQTDGLTRDLGTSYRNIEPYGTEGYVQPKKKTSAAGLGSMHIEFSLADAYPSLQMARVIIHEGTHKFAGTKDHAYTYNNHYTGLTIDQRIEKSDSFAYVAISIFFGQLIEDYEQCFKVVPQYGPPQNENKGCILF